MRCFNWLCVLISMPILAMPAKADWTLPEDAINNTGSFANCSYTAGSQWQPASVSCASSFSLNTANATLTVTEPLVLAVDFDLTLPNAITVNPDNRDFQIDAIGHSITTNGNDSSINADLRAESVTLNGDNTVLNGDIVTSGSATLNSGSTVNGRIKSGGTVMINGSVSSNIDSDSQVTINSGGSAGSVNSRDSVINNGTVTYYINAPTVTNNGSAGTICDQNSNYGPCEGSQDSQQQQGYCSDVGELLSYGIIGTSGFTYGSNSEIISDNTYNIEGAGNTPTPTGEVDTVDPFYPPLDPPSYPSCPDSNLDTINDRSSIDPGCYGTIEVNNNDSITFSGSSTNRYFIDELIIGNGATVTFGPGDYFITTITLSSGSIVETMPSGRTNLYIENAIQGSNVNKGKTNANQIEFNSSGSVTNLQVYLYEGATITIGEGNKGSKETINFNGLIYGPYPSNDITFGNNNDIQGSILTAGNLDVGNNTTFTYTSQIQEEIANSLGCTAGGNVDIDHYRLIFPRQLVSCFAAPLTIQACTDSNCDELSNANSSVTVESSATASTWSSVSSESMTAGNEIDFNFDDGVANADLAYVAGGLTTMSINTASPAAQNPLECYDLAGTLINNCALQFDTAGLVITDMDGQSDIPGQFAGLDFDTLLRAVETNTLTGACEARVEGSQQVNIGVEAINPNSPIGGESYTVNGTTVDLYSQGSASPSSTVSVNFNASGEAPLSNNYSDVGQVRMVASLFVAADSGNNDPAVTLTGSSVNSYVVKPHTLRLTPLNNDGSVWNSTQATGPGYRSAGTPFSARIDSYNASGNLTPNFGNEGVSVQAQFDSMAYPLPAAPSSDSSELTSSSPFTLLSAGQFSSDGLRWLEAGTVNLRARLGGGTNPLDDYLGAGDAYTRPVTAVGRFYPDRFIIDSDSINNTCTSTVNFTYMGEPGITVEYTVSAVNTDGNLTQNYANSGGINYTGTAVIDTVVTEGAGVTDDTQFNSRWSLSETNNWVLGELNEVATDGQFSRLADNSPDGPYNAMRVGLQVISEQDNRDFDSLDLATISGPAAALDNTNLNLRYGRTVLTNISGPDGVDLDIIMENQYFNSAGDFVPHTEDNCFDYDVADFDAGSESIIAGPTSPPFSNGELQIGGALFEAPTSPVLGIFPFSYNTDSWLEFDWDGDGTEENPAAVANFGYYRGNDRVIYWLERWR